jgi:hypothetical protein
MANRSCECAHAGSLDETSERIHCDDQYYREHLASLVRCLEAHPRAMLAMANYPRRSSHGPEEARKSA